VYIRAKGTVAEVAFSVAKEWQAKGVATVLLEKITEAAREKGFTELMAYTKTSNTGMIKLFKKLPYRIDTVLEGDTVLLKCNFETTS
jgi:GNAT superfamily N-acetyltransferase